MAELGAQEAMAVQEAQEAMAVQEAQEAMAVQEAQEAMAGGPCGHGLGPLGPAPATGTLLPPPQNFPGEVRGYQELSGAGHTEQYKTRQERPPGPDRQDRTAHRNRKPSRASSEAEATSGHDQESGALTRSLSDRLHFCDNGAGG